MTDYIGRALQEINPCGIESEPETHCQYAGQCSELGKKTGEFICLSKSAYQLAGFLLERYDMGAEKEDLRGYLEHGVNKGMVKIDPKEEQWNPQPLKQEDIEKTLDIISERGEKLFRSAQATGNERSPINFHVNMEAIAADLA